MTADPRVLVTRRRKSRDRCYRKARRATRCTWREPTGRTCPTLAVAGTDRCLLHSEGER